MNELETIKQKMHDCTRCSLSHCRTNLVFGDGNPNADIMFIGEAPGKNEDLQGIPFVGSAGHILDECLAEINLNRADVYIANILKCRPPKNRDPEPDEITACTPFLTEQVKAIHPKIIISLGAYATRYCLNDQKVRISQVRGQIFDCDGYYVMPIYHPAACIYDRQKIPIIKKDFQQLRAIINS